MNKTKEPKAKKARRAKGAAQIRTEQRLGGRRYGYDTYIRQPDGTRKRFRDFTFHDEPSAIKALAKVQIAGGKDRYGINPPPKEIHTTVKAACADYIAAAEAKQLTNRTDDTHYFRARPGHIHTLNRFIAWIKPGFHVTEIRPKHFTDWIKHEIDRAQEEGTTLKQSTIRRGLNTIRASLNLAVKSGEFKDLVAYRVPSNPLKKKVEKHRDRVLSDEEIDQISTKLKENPEHEEALFFFQLDLITGARMDELLRLKWDDSSTRFGTVYLFAGKTGKDRTIKVPTATQLIAKRRAAKFGGPINVLTKPDHWFREAFKEVSEALNITYGQRTPGGWTIHDLRHTCLTNLALDGVPLHGIMKFAGHASIVETEKYLKFMPGQMDMAARASSRLAQLSNAVPRTQLHSSIETHCPECGHYFAVDIPRKTHLHVVPKTGTTDQS
jgi:integrase